MVEGNGLECGQCIDCHSYLVLSTDDVMEWNANNAIVTITQSAVYSLD